MVCFSVFFLSFGFNCNFSRFFHCDKLRGVTINERMNELYRLLSPPASARGICWSPLTLVACPSPVHFTSSRLPLSDGAATVQCADSQHIVDGRPGDGLLLSSRWRDASRAASGRAVGRQRSFNTSDGLANNLGGSSRQ